MHLFIDTNIFLSFFHFSKDDLAELEKLAVLIRGHKVQLWLPEQAVNEFRRNRESKIGESLKGLREQRLNLSFPQICKDYPEYSTLQALRTEFEKQHAAMMQQLEKAVADEALKADELIKELFSLATVVEHTDAIVKAARLRMDLGNPPGKKGSLGDAVNWETLLAAVPNNEGIEFVSDDKDFCSPLDDQKFDAFLWAEWQETKSGEVCFYRRMSPFLKARFPYITLAQEVEKELAIEDLRKSGNFRRTHSVIARLAKFSDFTAAQAEDIVIAASQNDQVRLIADDIDVREFLQRIQAEYGGKLSPEAWNRLYDMVGPPF